MQALQACANHSAGAATCCTEPADPAPAVNRSEVLVVELAPLLKAGNESSSPTRPFAQLFWVTSRFV